MDKIFKRSIEREEIKMTHKFIKLREVNKVLGVNFSLKAFYLLGIKDEDTEINDRVWSFVIKYKE